MNGLYTELQVEMRLPNGQLASSEGVRAKNVVKQGGDGTLYERSTTAVRWRRIGENTKVAKEGRGRNKNRIPDQQEIHLGKTPGAWRQHGREEDKEGPDDVLN